MAASLEHWSALMEEPGTLFCIELDVMYQHYLNERNKLFVLEQVVI